MTYRKLICLIKKNIYHHLAKKNSWRGMLLSSGTEEKILKISNDLKKADEKQLQEVKTSRGKCVTV